MSSPEQIVKGAELLRVPEHVPGHILDYLPPKDRAASSLPWVTLTYAQSLDGAVSVPDQQLALSSEESKAVTHYLRAHHDAILVGANTALTDNPSLSCRLEGGPDQTPKHPRPIILDHRGLWNPHPQTKLMKAALLDNSRAPWVLTDATVAQDPKYQALTRVGGRVIPVGSKVQQESVPFVWEEICRTLSELGIESVMVEGGASVINGMWEEEGSQSQANLPSCIRSVIITICPIIIGEPAVSICPRRTSSQTGGSATPISRLEQPKWITAGHDVIFCGLVPG